MSKRTKRDVGRLLSTGSKLQWNYHPPLTVRASSSLRITNVSLVDGGGLCELYHIVNAYIHIHVHMYV